MGQFFVYKTTVVTPQMWFHHPHNTVLALTWDLLIWFYTWGFHLNQIVAAHILMHWKFPKIF